MGVAKNQEIQQAIFLIQIAQKIIILLKYSMKSIIVSTLFAASLRACDHCNQSKRLRKVKLEASQPEAMELKQSPNPNNQQQLTIIHGDQANNHEISDINQSDENTKQQMKKTVSTVSDHAEQDQNKNVEVIKTTLLSNDDQDQLRHRSQDVATYRRNQHQIFRSAAENVQKYSTKFDNIFLRFPTCDQLDRLIISADTGAILKTIQSIAIDENVPCDKKISYLLELQGRLKTAIQMKAHSAKQLQVVIDASYLEIQKAKSEIQSTYKLLDSLDFDQLKKNQKKYTKELQIKYNGLNDVQGQLPILRARVLGFEKQVGIINKDTEVQRSRVDNDRLKLIQVRNQIGKIQSRLREVQDIEAALRDRVNRSQQKVGQNEQNISQIKLKIKITEENLKKSKDDHDLANTQVKDLEVKVQRLRTDIAIAESKKDRYLKQISSLQSKLNVQKKKAINNDLDDLKQMVISLKELVPSVESSIDRHYYSCYGGGSSVKVQQNSGVAVYVVDGGKFGEYLRNLYGESLKIPSFKSDVSLNRVDIFGLEWSGKFGYPFVDSAFKNEDFSFSGSFSCINPGSVVSGCGTISAIGPDYIEAQDDKGSVKKFSLGPCTRLQSSAKVPSLGQKFYWKGVVGSRGYNLYSGSCFQ